MAWFKVDDHLAFHPKVLAAGNAAMGLWVRAGSWCSANLTDGQLPAHMIGTLGAQARHARRLVEVGLWERTDVGYRFKGWEEYQPSKAEVEAEREANRRRQAQWRERRRNAVSNDVTDTVSNGATNAAPTRPDPTYKDSSAHDHDDAPADDPKTPARKRARQLPDDWKPNDAHLELARQMRVDPAIELANFRDHAQATGRTLKDWDAGFRTWLRKARPSNVRSLPIETGHAKPKPRTVDPDAPFQPRPVRPGEENRIR